MQFLQTEAAQGARRGTVLSFIDRARVEVVLADGSPIPADVLDGVQVQPGARVLVLEDADANACVIGTFGVAPPSCLETTAGASAEMDPDAETLRVRDAEGSIIFEYDAEAQRAVVRSPRGDLRLETEGNLDLVGGRGVRVRTAGAIDAAASGGACVRSGRSAVTVGPASVGVRTGAFGIRARRTQIDSADTRVRSERAEISATNTRIKAERADADIRLARLNLGRVFTAIEGVCQTVAGRIRSVTRGVFQVESQRTRIVSKGETRIDGEKIHLG